MFDFLRSINLSPMDWTTAVDLDTLKRHPDRIRAGITDINLMHDQNKEPLAQITTALRLLNDCARLYAHTDNQGKRLANQKFMNGIEISEDDESSIRLAEPFAIAKLTPTHVWSSSTYSTMTAGRTECCNGLPVCATPDRIPQGQ